MAKPNKKKGTKKGAKDTQGGVKKWSIRFLKNWWAEKSPVLKFAVGFGLVMLLFYVFYFSSFYENVLLPATINFQAQIANGILNLFGYDTTVNGYNISSEEFAVSVKRGCDGIETAALLITGILIFPLPFKLKIPGFIAGLLVIFSLNLIRIVGLYLSGLYIPSFFDFLHLHGGFVIFTIASILVYIVWVQWAFKKQKALKNATTD